MYVLGASADEVYYRWNRSGSTTISSDCKTIHINSGASVRLTVKGTGRLKFSAKGWAAFYYKKDGQGETKIAYDSAKDITMDFSGEKEHTIDWYATSNPYYYGQEWGEISSITWKGSNVQYAALIELDANDGECANTLCHVKFGGLAGTLPTPTRVGHTFCGWYTAASGGTKISATTTVSANTTYYAHWTVNQYTVTFDANGGTGGTKMVIDYGSALGVLPTPLHDDYDFDGWFTATDGGTQVSDSATVTEDKIYYAHWLDPVPELPDNPTSEDVSNALEDAADFMLSDKIKTVAKYTAYRQWIIDKSLSHKSTKSSPNAWLAYALDAPELISKDSAVDKDDFQVDKLDLPDGMTSNLDFTFGLNEVVIGEESELDEVFTIEGSETLDDSSFSTNGLQVTYDRTEDGKVKATITPPVGKTTYFMRVKVK